MQLCISINKGNHPNIIAKVIEIKERGGSISGELAILLENSLDDGADKMDKLSQIIEEMTGLMSKMKAGVTFLHEETIHENTQDMLGSMMFGFADDEEEI